MPEKHALTIRLSPAQFRLIVALTEKLGIGKADVIRVALARLAEAENVLPPLHS